MKTSKLSNYDVSELLNMVIEMEHVVNTYSHVCDNAPSLKKSISSIRKKLSLEQDKRDAELIDGAFNLK